MVRIAYPGSSTFMENFVQNSVTEPMFGQSEKLQSFFHVSTPISKNKINKYPIKINNAKTSNIRINDEKL